MRKQTTSDRARRARRLRTWTAAATASAVACLSWAGSAAAAHNYATCDVAGHTDATAQWLDGTGLYTSMSLAIGCTVAWEGTVDLVDADVTSVGDFVNLVCGTGTAVDGDPTVNSVDSLSNDAQLEAAMAGQDYGYAILFGNDVGTLAFDGATAADPAGGGQIVIQPDQTFNPGGFPSGTCASGWNVTGTVAFSLPHP